MNLLKNPNETKSSINKKLYILIIKPKIYINLPFTNQKYL